MAARPPSLPRLLLVTGMSGAGKSTVLDALEDMGWDCVDNLPTALLEDFVHGEREARQTVPVAVGMDVRSRGFDPFDLPELLRSIKGVTPEILYLDCAGSELVRRYDETRRRHPLAPDRPAEDGIAKERDATSPLRRLADAVIDTTDLTPAELREELLRRYGGNVDQPVLTIVSFGFARGISRSADLVFDMRFAANPHWVDELRPLTGPRPGRSGLLLGGPGMEPGNGTDRDPVNRTHSPLLGRRQKLSDGGIWLHGRASPVGGGCSRNGGAVARRGFFSECPPS